jgi:hypothetical protein
MNRSILIVICDFLLLSLLTFSTDITHMADENTRPPTKVAVATNSPAAGGADLADAMRLALESERQSREQLQQKFAQQQQLAAQQQQQFAQQKQQLAQQVAQASNAVTEEEAKLSEREQENLRLRQQFTAVQTNAQNLTRALEASSAQVQQSEQRLTTVQTEAKFDSDLVDALQKQLNQLTKSNLLAQTEKEKLAGQLQLAEAESHAAAERAALMQQEVQATRAENAKLAEGFQMLATNSSKLTQEIRENRTLTPNTIFSDFVSNRVSVAILAARTGVFGGDASKEKKSETIVVGDGPNFYAVCHVQDTPLSFWDPGTDWQELTGTLASPAAQVPIRSLAFDQQDPRVVMFPLTEADTQKLGSKIYKLSSDPYKFQNAILVGADAGYYGECSFKIELDNPDYLRLDRSVLRGLFGKFNPSRGDLVFSQGGDLLGIMVNNIYCLGIRSFVASATFPFNVDLRARHTGQTLSQFYDTVVYLPPRLQ